MSEVSKRKPIAARRMDTAQAQHPFAISVNLVNDHAFDIAIMTDQMKPKLGFHHCLLILLSLT
jgi:hypothetical protein